MTQPCGLRELNVSIIKGQPTISVASGAVSGPMTLMMPGSIISMLPELMISMVPGPVISMVKIGS